MAKTSFRPVFVGIGQTDECGAGRTNRTSFNAIKHDFSVETNHTIMSENRESKTFCF